MSFNKIIIIKKFRNACLIYTHYHTFRNTYSYFLVAQDQNTLSVDDHSKEASKLKQGVKGFTSTQRLLIILVFIGAVLIVTVAVLIAVIVSNNDSSHQTGQSSTCIHINHIR